MKNVKSQMQEPAIDAYIAKFPSEVKQRLELVRQTIREAAPEAYEAISYGMPTFKLNGNLVHFAGYKKHIGFYPTPSGIEAFAEDLHAYHTSKGAIQFPLDRELPLDLIRRIVIFRVDEQKSK